MFIKYSTIYSVILCNRNRFCTFAQIRCFMHSQPFVFVWWFHMFQTSAIHQTAAAHKHGQELRDRIGVRRCVACIRTLTGGCWLPFKKPTAHTYRSTVHHTIHDRHSQQPTASQHKIYIYMKKKISTVFAEECSNPSKRPTSVSVVGEI